MSEDHIFPDGTDYIFNIVPACYGCNSAKRKRPVEQFLEEKGWSEKRIKRFFVWLIVRVLEFKTKNSSSI